MDIPISITKLGNGLNTNSGLLRVSPEESSDLQNVEFSKIGSIIKRRGYYWLNPTIIVSHPNIDGDISYPIVPREDLKEPIGFTIPNPYYNYEASAPDRFLGDYFIPIVTITHTASK